MNAEPTSRLDATLGRIEGRLAELLAPSRHTDALGTAMADAALAPGKRLRPLMTLVVAEDLGAPAAAALDVGCAVELVHAASLVLDDLPCMDDADLRRGRPTIHRRHGEDVAVLAAVALLNQSYAVLAEAPGLGAEARLACIAILTRAVGTHGLVAGQYQDLRGGRQERAMNEIVEANALKTGALFSAAIEMGAVVAGAEGCRADLVGFAGELGHAFQLLDDLIDEEESEESAGKSTGRDAGKSTVVALIGRMPARRRIERHVAEAHLRLDRVFGPQSRLAGLVDRIFEKALGANPAGEKAPDASPVGGAFGREAGVA